MSFQFDQAGYSVRGLANYILDLAEESGHVVTNMAINKLVYFLYEAFLLKEHKIITNARIEAWNHGPVFREIYQDFKKFGDGPIKGRASFYSVRTGKIEVSSVEMTPSDAKLAREIVEPLLPLPASKLREISHLEDGAWWAVWWYDGYANPGMEITPDAILSAGKFGEKNEIA